MNKKLILLLILIFHILNGVLAQANLENFLLSIKNEKKVENINISSLNTPLFPVPESVKSSYLGQEVLYSNRKFILHTGTNRVYEYVNDSLVRLDNTIGVGYNFGSPTYFYKDTIFSMGGYGFWHYNSSIRFFDEQMKEWSVIPTSQEAFISRGAIGIDYFNSKSGKVYLITTNPNLEYITDPSSDKKIEVQIFNFNTKKWGTNKCFLNDKIARVLTDIKLILRVPNGLLLNSTVLNKPIYLDFDKNAVYEVSVKKIVQLTQILGAHKKSITYNNDKDFLIYDYDLDSTFRFSIEKKDLTLLKFPIYVEYNNELNLNLQQISLFVGGLVIIILLALLLKSKKKYKEIVVKKDNTDIVKIDFKIFVLKLEIIEKETLRKIIENSIMNQPTSVNELNRILGTEKKDMKIQNNIRSEIIKSINEKFKTFSMTNETLINRERTIIDRRFMEYYFNKNLKNKFPLKYF
jgi:hypothetical protein